jgi:hypothetical protein
LRPNEDAGFLAKGEVVEGGLRGEGRAVGREGVADRPRAERLASRPGDEGKKGAELSGIAYRGGFDDLGQDKGIRAEKGECRGVWGTRVYDEALRQAAARGVELHRDTLVLQGPGAEKFGVGERRNRDGRETSLRGEDRFEAARSGRFAARRRRPLPRIF